MFKNKRVSPSKSNTVHGADFDNYTITQPNEQKNPFLLDMTIGVFPDILYFEAVLCARTPAVSNPMHFTLLMSLIVQEYKGRRVACPADNKAANGTWGSSCAPVEWMHEDGNGCSNTSAEQIREMIKDQGIIPNCKWMCKSASQFSPLYVQTRSTAKARLLSSDPVPCSSYSFPSYGMVGFARHWYHLLQR